MGTTNYHLYNRNRGKVYHYVDDVTRTYLHMGGYLLHIYPLIGVIDSSGKVIPIIEDGSNNMSDVVLNENNKRKYSHTTYDLYCATTLNPPQFSWSYAGISILDGDVLELTVHYNEMIEVLERKIIVGDVFEFNGGFRDLDILGKEKAQNKFYVVTSSERDENSWDPSYHFHLWKIKCKPIMDSPEYADLFNKEVDEDGNPLPTGGEDGFYVEPGDEMGGGGLDPSSKQDEKLQEQVDDIIEEAEGKDGDPDNEWSTGLGVSYRLHDEHHIFLAINDKYYIENRPNIVGIDGIPAEKTCEEVPYGEFFPKDAKEGEYFLRTDYLPPRLYKRIYTKTMVNTINIVCGDIRITDGELNITGKKYDGSIKYNNELVGSIDKDRVYINGQYIGYITETGKIANNGGLIIGTVTQTETIHKKGWVLEELDRRERWHGVPAVLRNVINNENTFINNEGDTEKMRQNMKLVANRRVKKEHKKDRPWNKRLQKNIAETTGVDYDIIGIKKP